MTEMVRIIKRILVEPRPWHMAVPGRRRNVTCTQSMQIQKKSIQVLDARHSHARRTETGTGKRFAWTHKCHNLPQPKR